MARGWERERAKRRNTRVEGIRDAFNMQLPEWNCRRIGGNMDVRDIWLGRTVPRSNFPRSFFFSIANVYKVFFVLPETRSSRGGEEYSRETLIYASFAEAATRRIHLGIKSLSKRGGYEGGWQLGQLVIRDWSRFFLHLLLSWRMCNFLGCAGRRELCFHY